MTVETNIHFNKDIVTQLSKQKAEPDWMLNIRLNALEKYLELPLPYFEKTKIDNWNIDEFSIDVKEGKEDLINELPENIQSIVAANTEDRSVLVQKSGSILYQQLSKKLSKQGVIYMGLEQAVQEHPELVQKYFMKDISFEDNKITALHTALWNGGIFLYIPKNVEVEFPIQALYVADTNGLLPHLLIVAEENSSVTYVDHYFAETEKSTVHNGVVEVYVGDGAKVRFATIHNFNDNMYDYTYRQATVGRDGKMEWIIGEMNEGNTVSNNTSILKGNAAQSDSKSIFIGIGKQKTNFVSKVVHEGTHTESGILSHAVMLDQSTAIFNGITHMKKGAVKSNAEQAEKVLMLNEGARGDANPILLIDEHDVMAGHAASAGPVNPNDVYYLMSRGISKQEAERLVIHGFLAPVVSRIPIEGMLEQLEKVIERKLSK